MSGSEILKAIIEYHEANHDARYFGIRSDDADMKNGESCRQSHDWDMENDCESEDYLSGTCATGIAIQWFDEDDLDAVELALAQNEGYTGKYKYLIAGYGREFGNDEAESIIADAVVVCRI